MTIQRAFLFAAVAAVSACSTTGDVAVQSSAANPPLSPIAKTDQKAMETASTNKDVATNTASRLPNTGSDQTKPPGYYSVFFDFDSNAIKPDQRSVIENHGKFLLKQQGLKTLIQGNTDERGSREYNLALGNRRAEAVKKALAAMGVRDSQLEAISYGEEKPFAQGHDEAAWEQNRRSDIVYPKQ